MLETNQIYNGDCISVMKEIDDKSINMILCDLPYGTTACKWDTIIPFEPLWLQYKRIIKDNGAIVLTASQPFTTALIASNYGMFKYEWIWDKDKGFGVFTAKKRPLKKHENILVFYKSQPTYNFQMKEANPKRIRPLSKANISGARNNITNSDNCKTDKNYNPNKRYPDTILTYSNPVSKAIHPTQKPVALFEYLIKTYTNENDLVLDNCIGSGTTAVACINTGRNFIGIEKDKEYFEIAQRRIKNAQEQERIDQWF
jgi:site-specific DNA-methyltransferase (adenine-specific)